MRSPFAQIAQAFYHIVMALPIGTIVGAARAIIGVLPRTATKAMQKRKKDPSGSGRASRVEGSEGQFRHSIGILSETKLRSQLKLTEDHIRSVLLIRRARAAVFEPNLFSDPAWDILLELYAAELAGRTMSPAELAQSAETPLSTTIRWIAALREHGLVYSPGQPTSSVVRLTREAVAKIEQLTDRWGSAFVSI